MSARYIKNFKFVNTLFRGQNSLIPYFAVLFHFKKLLVRAKNNLITYWPHHKLVKSTTRMRTVLLGLLQFLCPFPYDSAFFIYKRCLYSALPPVHSIEDYISWYFYFTIILTVNHRVFHKLDLTIIFTLKSNN